MKMGGGNASGFREGIRQKAANFEPGTDLRRTHGAGFSRVSFPAAKGAPSPANVIL
ncbi:hypothetical protein SBA3_2920006 [Candidatus Sulfopaludibacter sp. SbA3]|nr:hypothetical protein SBA3_2920006 [Candidatus Sulfopaludibacter sp. SbA3]